MESIFRNKINRYHSLSMSKFSKYYEEVDQLFQDVAFSYKGSFDSENLEFINYYVEQAVHRKGKSRTNLFKIFIELAQNIAENSEDVKKINGELVGCGIMLIHEYDDKFKIFAGNPGSKKNIEKYIEKCKIINSLDLVGLREYRREMLKLPATKKGNGNIGLIKIAITSGSYLDVNTVTIDDQTSFITIQVDINK